MAGFRIDSSRVNTRITATLSRLKPDSPEARAALFRIGTLLRNNAIDELTSLGAVDRGQLRASLKFEIESSGYISRVIMHTSGVRYARIVELGGAFTEAMRRAMFAAFRLRGSKPRAGKGIVKGGWYRSRPYMSPAARRAQPQILEEIRRLTMGTSS